MDIQKAADALYEAERGAYQIPMVSQENPGMTVADAYAVQLKNIQRRLDSGEKLVGMKIGLTSKGMQQLLDAEAKEAFVERKRYAKQLGEEASTKLLIPMGLMLLLVFAILMLPAMMNLRL